MKAKQVVFATLGTALLLLVVPQRVAAPAPAAAPEAYEPLREKAERLYAEGSYAMAHRLYREAASLELSAEQARWVAFRTADTRWRAHASSESSDTTDADEARDRLQLLIDATPRVDERDRVWAEAQESLGDFWWTRRLTRNWSRALTHYQQALDWWAGSQQIELARRRYLQIVWTMAEPPQAEPYYYYGYYGNAVPLQVLENALEIAATEENRSRAHYLVAMTIRQQGGDWRQRRRVPQEFEAALAAGRRSRWHDDALYHYAEWMAGQGRVVLQGNGKWRSEPDFLKAVELFRTLLDSYEKGETRYHDQARQRIEGITGPQLGVSVSNIFLPGSEIQYQVSWRNVRRVDLALYRVDLTRDLAFTRDASSAAWIQQISLTAGQRVAAWTLDTDDRGDHRPGQEALRLNQTPERGAYVIEASSGELRAREVVLVSDASMVLKVSGRQALVYVCDALDGSPLAQAHVRLWQRHYRENRWAWRQETRSTDENGFALYDLSGNGGRGYGVELFASAAIGDRQAFAAARAGYGQRSEEGTWRIYASTDRPAYRPGETARFKFVARIHDGAVYSTPAGERLVYEIIDPRGARIDGGELMLNRFGSGWGSVELDETMPLGEYRARFWTAGKRHIGDAMLFRLEEYKLPEFRVRVRTPEENGRRKSFRTGDTIEVEIEADYYFGGPVVAAKVEVLVFQKPFHHAWWPQRDYPWFYEDMTARPTWYGPGQIVKRETLRTDMAGKAQLRFDTPANTNQDLEFRIEARVTDASRREIVGGDRVRVARQSYYVHPRSQHNLYRPRDRVELEIIALDANEQPVSVAGTVSVTRDHWHEVWVDSQGRKLSGAELERLRREQGKPHPADEPHDTHWHLEFRGYRHEEILTRPVQTDDEGRAELDFVPQREGYYRVRWDGREEDGSPISAETAVWVAGDTTRFIGYRHAGVEIIVDRDTFRVGEKVPVMISAETSGRHVLFSVEGEELYDHRLVHLEGHVKLLEIEIGELHVPNIFLGAAMVSDGELHVDVEQVVVPPLSNFLDVELEYDRELYGPRDEGWVAVTTRDHQGRPVAAEVALGVVDESVFAIQQDYAGDPRQFYFGTKRRHLVRTHSTFQHKRYTSLAVGRDERRIEGAGGRYDVEEDRALREEVQRYSAAGNLAPGVAAKSGPRMVADEMVAEAEAAAPPDAAAVQVRTDFRSTVLWQPDVMTGADGRARVEVRFPDTLTAWRATARAVGERNRFGIRAADTRTRKPLIVRFQAPRFFVAGDSLVVSAVINNNTDEPIHAMPAIEAEGVRVEGRLRDGIAGGGAGPVEVPPHGEVRVDWQVSVNRPGQASFTVEARGGGHADAMQKSFRIHPHGLEKLVARSGKLSGDEVTVLLELPREREAGSTHMTLQVAPSLAVTMLDALPYLIDYPYGCTEQTMSRFLPAAITAQTLKDLGVDPQDVMGKVFGGIEQLHADRTHPESKGDLREMEGVIEKGLRRLYDFQHADGGWGWWKEGESDHFMTAYVVWGLSLAREAGVGVRRAALDRAVEYLDREIVEQEEHPDMQAWMLHALAIDHSLRRRGRPGKLQAAALENLWTRRDRLNAYTRSLLALSAHAYGDDERARVLVRNLENGVRVDRSPDTSVVMPGNRDSAGSVMGTAHWGEDGIFWRWSEGGVEATAFALSALLQIDPGNALIEPVTNWLIKNRRGAQWSNTRDTAIAVLALNQYLRRSGELHADLDFELVVNGQRVIRRQLTAEDALAAPSRYAVDPTWVRDGVNEIRIVRRRGTGPLYFSAEARYFSLEEPITAVGNEIFVRRQYYRLVGRPTLLKGHVYEKRALEDGDEVASGDRIETVITIEAKNNYEYLVFEDLKPAGLESVGLRSGEPLQARELKAAAATSRLMAGGETPSEDHTGRRRAVYRELRDRKVALFIDKLAQGLWEIRYEMRAEVPGRFHALPVTGHAMYVPEIRCNGNEIRLAIREMTD